MEIKRRFINKKTKQHGIQLTYKELLVKIDETIDQFWNGTVIRANTITTCEKALHDLAYAYNIKQFPVKKTDERTDKWIIGFANIGFDPHMGMFVINFELVDSLSNTQDTKTTLGMSKFVP